ncbi:MAG TPA: nucleotidyltransferase family protein [Longimicrobium sp.]|nr:nucleotidyltransferase family protein [Longimicrobium sp.]
MPSIPTEPGRAAWLLGTSEPPRGPRDSVEFAEACAFALSAWQVLPAVAPRLLAWGGRRRAGDPAAQRVRDRLVGLDVLGRVQLRICARLIETFQQRGIPYAMLKGSAVRFAAYPDPKLRVGKDFDIAVPRRLLRRAEEATRDCGFIAAQWDPATKRFHLADPVLRARVEAQHYELGFLVRRQLATGIIAAEEAAIRRDLDSQFIWHLTEQDELACYVSVDLHHGLSLEVDVEPLVERAAAIDWDGLPVRLPPPEWTLFHVIYKIYWEGVHNYGKGAYQFADLVRLIPATSEATFARLLEILRQYRLEAAGYYVLRRLSRNFGVSPRPEVEAFLERASHPPPELEPLQVNDLGDMWPKLWSAR